MWYVIFLFHYISRSILTVTRCGGGVRVAPVTPDARLSGAIDAHWVTPHLDKIYRARPEACQTT